MKKLVFAIFLLAVVSPILTSCRDTKEKTVVVEKEVEKEEGALERAAKKVDEEVNEEIDETIEEIGDDN